MKLKLLGKLARGSWGVVYKAVDKKTGKYYAVKKFVNIIDENGIAGDIIREINVYSRMNHANIISSPMFILKRDRALIVMELGDMNLDDLADKRDTIKYDRLKIVYQLACGLLYLKRCGLVHEDFSSSNLLFMLEGGDAKIADLDMRIGITNYPMSDVLSLATILYNLYTNSAYEPDMNNDEEMYEETQTNLKLLPRKVRDTIVGLSNGEWSLDQSIRLSIFKKYDCIQPAHSIFDTARHYERALNILQMRNRSILVEWIYGITISRLNNKTLIEPQYRLRFFVTAVDILDRFYPDPRDKSELQLYAAVSMLIAGKLLIKSPYPLITVKSLVYLADGAFSSEQLYDTEWLIINKCKGECYHTTILDTTPNLTMDHAIQFLLNNQSPI